jgi:hypothetical protein
VSELIMAMQGSGNTGRLGTIELYPDKVVMIKQRKGFLQSLGVAGATTGDRTIFLDQITSVQVYSGGLLSNGFIRFILPGTSVERRYTAREAVQDENALTFIGKKDAEMANMMKAKIEELKSKSSSRANSASATTVPQSTISTADEIKKFKQLLDDKVITEEEFNKKKKELLGL